MLVDLLQTIPEPDAAHVVVAGRFSTYPADWHAAGNLSAPVGVQREADNPADNRDPAAARAEARGSGGDVQSLRSPRGPLRMARLSVQIANPC